MYILLINPCFATTRIGVYNERTQLIYRSINHDRKHLMYCNAIYGNKEHRKQIVNAVLKEHGFHFSNFDVFIGKNGAVLSVGSHITHVGNSDIYNFGSGSGSEHTSNLGGGLALEFAKMCGVDKQVYIVNPVIPDRQTGLTGITGLSENFRMDMMMNNPVEDGLRALVDQVLTVTEKERGVIFPGMVSYEKK